MSAPHMQTVDHPSAWRADDFHSLEPFYFELGSRHVEALDQALHAVQRRGLAVAQIGREDFPLSAIESDIQVIYDQLLFGKGVVIVRRLPVERYSLEELELIYWGLGTHLGTGVSQSVMGDRIGHVTDVSGKDPNERAYRNSLAIPPHTDLADIVGMLSVRKAKDGGASTYVSVIAMHNEILARRPEHLASLYRGYRMHRFGEQPPGEPPVTRDPVPVLGQCDGLISTRIVPEYIDMAEVELGEKMPMVDRAALDYFLALADDPRLRIELMLEPGELSFINNYFILHSRTAFYDDRNAGAGRLLLRLWLVAHDRRPVPANFARAEGDGIEAQPGRENSYFEGDTASKAHHAHSYQD